MGQDGSNAGRRGVTRVQKAKRQESSWFAEARALLLKDLRAEMRTRVAVNSVGLFSFSSLLLLGLATRGLKDIKTVLVTSLPMGNLTIGAIIKCEVPAWSEAGKMGLLWTLLCFAAFTGLSHSFVHEEEAGTITALRLTMSPAGAYAGKLAYNIALLSVVAVIVTPCFMALTGMQVQRWIVFIIVMAAGCTGLASAATIVAALAAKARGSGALFGAIGLPVVTVFLLLLLNAAGTEYNRDAGALRIVQDVGGLVSFSILLITVSAFSFRFVWEE